MIKGLSEILPSFGSDEIPRKAGFLCCQLLSIFSVVQLLSLANDTVVEETWGPLQQV